MNLNQLFQTAHKIQQCVTVMRGLHGDKWPARRADLQARLQKLAAAKRQTVQEAAIGVAKKASGEGATMAVIEIVAATFDHGQ